MRAHSIANLDGVRIFKGNLTVSYDVKLQPVGVAVATAAAAIAEKERNTYISFHLSSVASVRTLTCSRTPIQLTTQKHTHTK